MREYSIAEKAAMFDQLLAQGKVDIVYLTDMSSTLERIIDEELVELHEPVWNNPVTGNRASSICSAFRVLGFTVPKGKWVEVIAKAKLLKSYHSICHLYSEHRQRCCYLG